MAQSWTESTRDTYYGQYLNQLGIQLWTIPKSIPAEYDKSNTGIRTDPEEDM